MMATNKARVCLFCILLVLSLPTLSAWSPIRSYYKINNISGEDLFITIRYSDNARISAWKRFWHGYGLEKAVFVQGESSRHYYTLFDYEPERRLVRGSDGEWQFILVPPPFSPKEMVEMVIDELILYDLEGNIILTLNDIQDEHFEYTNLSYEEKLSPCIMVTSEMVQDGREKYGESRQEEENNANQ